MSTTATASRASRTGAPFSTANKVGLVLAGVLGTVDLVWLAFPTPPGEVGPPLGILILGGALAVLTIVAVVLGWRRRSRGMVRLAAGARIISLLSALPAFFAGVPAIIVAIVSVITVLTVTAVVLMLLPARRPVEA